MNSNPIERRDQRQAETSLCHLVYRSRQEGKAGGLRCRRQGQEDPWDLYLLATPIHELIKFYTKW